ncbi:MULTISPECIES: response regulator transcription factor [unclassified Luteococcus]|uniref:response regulator transcription factor n=1 Tax=unclassified Luteococcus TaxID=2639923 RepID=UPI00313CE8F8
MNPPLTPAPAPDASRTVPIRILLVDDQPLFRRAIATLIDAQPDLQVVGQASNGLEGVELAHELQPDVVLMDVEMPVMNGVEAAGRILEDLPATKVVLLTVSEDDEYLLPAVRQGVHGYLLKDMHPDELFETFRQVMRGESPFAPALVGRLLAELRGQGPTPRSVATATEPRQELSQRELEILQLVAGGLSNREIGNRLSITEGTVKNHVHNALRKLHMDNRIQAAAYIVRKGLGAPRQHTR